MVLGCIEHGARNYISGRGDLDIDEIADHLSVGILSEAARVVCSYIMPCRSRYVPIVSPSKGVVEQPCT